MGRIHLRVGVVAVAISAAIFCHANAIAADTKIPLILADDSGTETSARQSAITLHDQGDWDAYDNAVAIAKKNMMGAPDAALEKAQDAENIVRGFPNSARQREALATSLWLQAESITRLNRPVESAPLIAKAFTYISEEVSPLSGDLLLARGRNARILGDVARALESFQAANGIFAKLGNARKEAIALQSIGTLYANARLYDRVIEYYSTASRVFSDDATLDLSSFNNRANAYRELGSFDEARRLFDASLEMAQALESDMLQARILTNIATLETRRGNFIAAESAITQAVEHAQIDGARGWLPLAYGARAELALAQNDFNGSLKALDAIFSEVDIESTSTLFRDTHKVAYKVHKALGEHEVALQHLESFKRHDDNGRDLATSANLALLNAEFEFAKQKFEIAKLRSEQLQNDVALADVRERLRNAINIGLLAGGALLLVFFGLAAKSARRSERMTSSLNRKLESKNEELIVTNTRLEKANQAKMEFLAATSHEIRTPLNAIIGLTDVMLNGEAIIERDRGYLKLVNSSGKNLLNIVNDILDISKLEANRIEVKNRAINITDGLLDVAGLWRRPAVEKGLLFDVQISSDPIYYHCDDRLLRQILSNLISNAIKFTSEGSITISLRNLRGDSFTLAVSDTGIGIAQENHESIFETFQQIDASLNRNYEGTGLGLAICKKIAEALGGDVTLTSVPGQGSTFEVIVRVPRIMPSKANSEPSKLPDANIEQHSFQIEGGPDKLRVLVAEDNHTNVEVITAQLEDIASEITCVENGQEVLTAVQNGSYDVILMDIHMPIMDGKAATRAIRSLPTAQRDIPIVCVTADVRDRNKEDCIAAGMDSYVSKPIKVDSLLLAIRDAIARKQMMKAS